MNKFIIYLLVGASPFLAVIAVLIKSNTITLVILNFTLTLVSYFSDYFGDMERDAIIKNLNQYEFIAEHQFVAETVKIISRVISFGFFVVIGLFSNFTTFKMFLLIILAASPLKFMVMFKQRLVRKELVTRNKELGIESSETVTIQE